MTSDYEPVDIGALCALPLPTAGSGDVQFRGIPFSIGRDGHVIGVGGASLDPVRIPLHGLAHHLVVAHALLERTGTPPFGTLCAQYVVRWEDGQEAQTPIREHLEIALVPTGWGYRPLLAMPDANDHTLPRYEGAWGQSGLRLTHAVEGWARAFYLWDWRNPRPEVPLESLTVIPNGPRMCIGAVTLGRVDEPVFPRRAKSAVVIDVDCDCPEDEGSPMTPDVDTPPMSRKPVRLKVDVDRGVSTHPYRLPIDADVVPGWGEADPAGCGPAYVEIAATPSATVRIRHGDDELGTVRWAELERAGALEVADGVRVRVADNPRNWVQTRVVDADTGATLPCRIHFRSADGIPFPPQGHHTHVAADLDSWHYDVGGDVRLGHTTYAYIDGECEGWLPRGAVLVDAARGFEYEPVRRRIEIAPDQRVLEVPMRRLRDLAAERQFSGDTHVHFLSTQGGHLEAAGEGLNVVNLLLASWGHLFTNTEEFTGGPSVSHRGETIVYASQENRQHLLGHLSLLGVKKLVAPWASGGVEPSVLGDNLETTLSRWADEAHAHGGTVVVPHIPLPNCETAALVATGRADAVELLMRNPDGHAEYYRYLNAGYRLPLVGGTDKMSADVPVGMVRTYVHIPDDEPFDYDTWCRHLRAGRTFQTSGPLLSFTVEGHGSGSTITLPAGGGHVEVAARADSVIPFSSLEVVINGEVAARTESLEPTRHLELRDRLEVDAHSWIAARCGGRGYWNGALHHDVWRRGVMAHTSPVYVAVGGSWDMFDPGTATYMTSLLEGGIQYIRHQSLQWPEDQVLHRHDHRDHLAFLEEPFHEALEAIHQRLHAHGIPH